MVAVDSGELEVDQGSFQRTAKDLFAGAVGGIAQVLLGQSSQPSHF